MYVTKEYLSALCLPILCSGSWQLKRASSNSLALRSDTLPYNLLPRSSRRYINEKQNCLQ